MSSRKLQPKPTLQRRTLNSESSAASAMKLHCSLQTRRAELRQREAVLERLSTERRCQERSTPHSSPLPNLARKER